MSGLPKESEGRAAVREVVAGDEFVIPGGFEGTWEVTERTRKIYVISEAVKE